MNQTILIAKQPLPDLFVTDVPSVSAETITKPAISCRGNGSHGEAGPVQLTRLIAKSQIAQVRLRDIRGLSRHIPGCCMGGYQRQISTGAVSNFYIEVLASTQSLCLVKAASKTDSFKFEVIANARLWILLEQLPKEKSESTINARIFSKLTNDDIELFAKSELFASFHSLFPHRELMSSVLSDLCSAWGKNLISWLVPKLRSKQKIAEEFGFSDRSSLAPRTKSEITKEGQSD
jgi:hypothetical protein